MKTPTLDKAFNQAIQTAQRKAEKAAQEDFARTGQALAYGSFFIRLLKDLRREKPETADWFMKKLEKFCKARNYPTKDAAAIKAINDEIRRNQTI